MIYFELLLVYAHSGLKINATALADTHPTSRIFAASSASPFVTALWSWSLVYGSPRNITNETLD